jgi:hypothetical protein
MDQNRRVEVQWFTVAGPLAEDEGEHEDEGDSGRALGEPR